MKKIIMLVMMLSMILVSFTCCNTGLELYKEANDVADNSAEAIDSLAISLFNSQFERFEFDETKGRMIKSLVTTIEENNKESSNKVDMAYKLLDNTIEKDIENIKSLIDVNKNYKIEISQYNKQGYVSEVLVTELN